MTTFFQLFTFFFLYSLLGWIAEVIYNYIAEKKFINTGFLIGPYCPIYGINAIIMIYYLNQYADNPLTVFILAFVISGIIEYLTSYFMEKIFHARWWDYSDFSFNINGRICLRFLVFFGILALLLIYVLNPIITNILTPFNNIMLIISIILFILFLTDVITSLNVGYKVREKLINIHERTEKITKELLSEAIEKNKYLQKRLIKSFPRLKPIKIKKK